METIRVVCLAQMCSSPNIPPNNMFILIKIHRWSLTTVLIRFKWKLILCSICDRGAFTFPATSGDCPYSQICHIWLFNLVKWSTRSFGTNHKPDAGSCVKSQLWLSFGSHRDSQVVRYSWLSTQGTHRSPEVNDTIIFLPTISCLGEINFLPERAEDVE